MSKEGLIIPPRAGALASFDRNKTETNGWAVEACCVCVLSYLSERANNLQEVREKDNKEELAVFMSPSPLNIEGET